MQHLTTDQNEGYINVKGEAVTQKDAGGKSFIDGYRTRLSDRQAAIAETLTPEQRDLFMQHSERQTIQSFEPGLNRHYLGEFRSWSKSTNVGSIDIAVEGMSLNYGDAEAMAQYERAIRASAANLGRDEGWAAEQTSAYTMARLSDGWRRAITAAVDQNAMPAANALFAQYEKEMVGTDRERANSLLNRGNRSVERQRIAKEAETALPNGSLIERIAFVREKYSGEPEEDGVAELKVWDGERRAARKADDSDFLNAVERKVVDRPSRGTFTASEWDRLEKMGSYKAVNDYIRSRQEAAARGEGDIKTDWQKFFSATDLARDDPVSFVRNMDRLVYRPIADTAQWNHLVSLRNNILSGKKDGATQEVQTTGEIIKTRINRLVDDGALDKKDVNKTVELFNGAISLEKSRNGGKALTYEQQRGVLDNYEIETQKHSLWRNKTVGTGRTVREDIISGEPINAIYTPVETETMRQAIIKELGYDPGGAEVRRRLNLLRYGRPE
jgi:hypothetical protein